MIRVAVLDDHPLVLASLEGLLQDAADLQPVIAAADGQQLWRQLDDARPGVVVLDYDLARGDGLTLCQRLKDCVRPPVLTRRESRDDTAVCSAVARRGRSWPSTKIAGRELAVHLSDAQRYAAAPAVNTAPSAEIARTSA